MQFNRLVEALKSRLRLTVLCTIFLGLTTFASIIIICIMARTNTNYPITDTSLGMLILGSLVGQVTLLIAIPLVDKLGKARKRKGEDVKDELEN